MVEKEAKEAKPWSRKTARILKRMGYKWKPEPGQWVCCRLVKGGISEPELIVAYNGRQVELHRLGMLTSARGLVPVLPWGRIAKILEGMGYIVKVKDQEDFGEDCKYNCGIYSDKLGVGVSAPTRQEAVMRAIIQLAKRRSEIAKTKRS